MRMEEFLPPFMVGWPINSDKFTLEHPLSERRAQLGFNLEAVADGVKRTIIMPDADVDLSVIAGTGDHAQLSNIVWLDAAHEGPPDTLAGFGTLNAPLTVTMGAGMDLTNGVLSNTAGGVSEGLVYTCRDSMNGTFSSPINFLSDNEEIECLLPLDLWVGGSRLLKLFVQGRGLVDGVSTGNTIDVKMKIRFPGETAIQYGDTFQISSAVGYQNWMIEAELQLHTGATDRFLQGTITYTIENATKTGSDVTQIYFDQINMGLLSATGNARFVFTAMTQIDPAGTSMWWTRNQLQVYDAFEG